MTVLEAIQRSADFLAKKGVDSPRLQAELLLADLLRLPRMQLYLNFERALTDAEADALRDHVQRRGMREPLQHIVGSTSFCGLELAVNRDVLIPRPETEQLAELAWQFLNSLLSRSKNDAADGQSSPPLPSQKKPLALHHVAPSPEGEGRGEGEQLSKQSPSALDFGTGSGCLAVALAAKCPSAQISALDISPDALIVARKNAARHQVDSRIQFFLGDGFAALPPDARFDLIVSNPPYIPGSEIASLEPEVRDFDPRLALDGGADGLDFYRRLARDAGTFLKPGGRIMLEFGDGQEGAVKNIFELQKWIVEAIKPDYSGRMRILVAHAAGQ